jgi:hypothetical protein
MLIPRLKAAKYFYADYISFASIPKKIGTNQKFFLGYFTKILLLKRVKMGVRKKMRIDSLF